MGKSQMMVLMPFDVCRRCEVLTKQCSLRKRLRGFRWFECDICGRINEIVCVDPKNIFATCCCGYIMCLLCMKEAHFPLKCKDAETYRSVSSSVIYGYKKSTVTVNVRKCPHCGVFCEKSYGCNHMICNCGKEFCYNCCQNYVSFEDHNKCETMEFEIDLIDIPRLSNLLPRYIYDKCMAFRYQHNVDEISRLSVMLSEHKVPIGLKKRIIFVIYWGYMALEYACVLTYLRRKQLKKMNKSTMVAEMGTLGVALKLGFMEKCYDKLQFLMHRLEQFCENKNASLHKLAITIERAERALTRAVICSE